MNKIEELIKYIGSKHALRIEQWRDESKAWRCGLDWFSTGDYVFLCEKKELIDALKMCKDFIDKNIKK